MRVIGFLVCLFSLPALGATYAMESCPSTSKLYRAVDCGDGDCCPPVLSNCTASATGSTTAEGGCDTDTQQGTAYLCLNENASPPATFVADPSDPTGCDFHGSTAVSSASFTRAATGLTSSTTYYPHFGQKYAQRASTTTSGSVPTPTTGGAATASAGHWIGVNCHGGDGSGSVGCQDLTQRMMDSEAVGFLYRFRWKELHTGIGSYTFSELEQAANTARNLGKQWMLNIDSTGFGAGAVEIPDFMLNNTIYGGIECPGKCGTLLASNSNTRWARIWDSDVRDAFRDLLTGLAANFADDGNFVGVSTGETTVKRNEPGDTFSCQTWQDSLIAVVSDMVDAFGGARVVQNVNFLCDAQYDRVTFAQHLKDTYNVNWSTPDLYAGSKLPEVDNLFEALSNDTDFDAAPSRMPEVQVKSATGYAGELSVTPAERYEFHCGASFGAVDPQIIIWWDPTWADVTRGNQTFDVINAPETYPLPCP